MKAILLCCILFIDWSFASAQCVWPDSVSSHYKLAAYQVIFDKAYVNGENAVTQKVLLPEDSMKMVLDLMGCVYNQTGGARDSIFQPNAFRFLHYYEYNSAIYEFGFNAYAGVPYADSLYKGKKTGKKTLDSLIDKYQLTIDLYELQGTYVGSVHSPYALNTEYLSGLLNIASGSTDFKAVDYLGDGNRITLRRSADTLLLKFSFRWGDCQSGCIWNKNLTYKFYDSSKIHGPYYADNIPKLNPGPHYLISNIKNKSAFICNKTDGVTNYYPSISYPYNFYIGKGWGKWMVNGNDQTAYMVTHRSLRLQDSGTFYISHIPDDANGVWYHDTFQVKLYEVTTVPGFISQDTFQFCPQSNPPQDYYKKLLTELDSWLQDSIANKSWNFYVPSFAPDSSFTKLALISRSNKLGCSLNDTVNVKAIFYPGIISRNIEQQCHYSPAEFKPHYPVKLLCPDQKQDTVCYYFAPDTRYVTYDYMGCPVGELLKITLRDAPGISLNKNFNLSGYDSLVLDAGNNWKTVTWNGSVSQQKFTFKGQNKNRKDTVLVRAEEQNGCYDSLIIVIQQTSVASVSSPLASSIRVYPNPAGQTLNIETHISIPWVIYDLRARPMLRGKGDAVVELVDWSPGLYVLHTSGTGFRAILFEIVK